MRAELKNDERWQKTCSGQAVAWSRVGSAAAKIPTPPPKGEGVRACTKTAVPKRQAGTAVAFRRGTALLLSSYSSALHSKSGASMAQLASRCRFCVFPWLPEGTKYQVSMQAP